MNSLNAIRWYIVSTLRIEAFGCAQFRHQITEKSGEPYRNKKTYRGAWVFKNLNAFSSGHEMHVDIFKKMNDIRKRI